MLCNQRVAVVGVETVSGCFVFGTLFFRFFERLGDFLKLAVAIFSCDLSHDLVKPLGHNLLDALRLVNLVDGDAFVLKREEQEQHLVDLLLKHSLLLLHLLELLAHYFLVHNQVKLAVSNVLQICGRLYHRRGLEQPFPLRLRKVAFRLLGRTSHLEADAGAAVRRPARRRSRDFVVDETFTLAVVRDVARLDCLWQLRVGRLELGSCIDVAALGEVLLAVRGQLVFHEICDLHFLSLDNFLLLCHVVLQLSNQSFLLLRCILVQGDP